MTNPHIHVRLLTLLRHAWDDYLSEAGRNFTEEFAEDSFASAHHALATLADELRVQLRLGVATEVRVFSEEKKWYPAVYFDDRRAKRCSLCEYFQMPDDASEEDIRRAVVEVAFVHNVQAQPYDVQVDDAEGFANWRKSPDCEEDNSWEEDGR